MSLESPEILLVEDNLADAKLTAKILARCAQVERERIHISDDGEAALRYLRAEEPWQDRPMPQLVFLDLNLPRVSGLELLRIVREDPALTGLPVIVLSSSVAQRDVERAYELRVNAYVRKPVDLVGLQELMRSIDRFWLQSCLYPEKSR